MNCTEIRRNLEQRFDEGLGLVEGFEPHLESCEACKAYSDRLQSLHSALVDLPLEDPGEALVPAIKASLGEQGKVVAGASGRGIPGWGALAVAVVVSTCVLGWFYPITLNIVEWGTEWSQGLSEPDWRAAGAEVLTQWDVLQSYEFWRLDPVLAYAGDQAQWVWTALLTTFQSRAGASSVTLWLALALVSSLLIAFNGFEASRLRAPGISSRRKAKP